MRGLLAWTVALIAAAGAFSPPAESRKDEPITKNWVETLPDEGEVAHQSFTFCSGLTTRQYFAQGKSILVQLWNKTVLQSSDEGYTWREVIPRRYGYIWIHPYADERAYIVGTTMIDITTDGGQSWNSVRLPLQQPSYLPGRLSFHPTQPDYLIWTGDVACWGWDEDGRKCHIESYLSLDHGRNWRLIETYVLDCMFAETFTFKADDDGILCSSYQNKTGDQHPYTPGKQLVMGKNLVIGKNWYEDKKKLFDHIIGFGTFGEYLMVAALTSDTYALTSDTYAPGLQISLAGKEFVPAKLPQGIQLRNNAFPKVLQATPDAIFLQEGISGKDGTELGTLLKSNANGTYYGVSLEHVNGNREYETAYHAMPGVDGVARVNILTNSDEKVQTRITHNDGGSWQALKPPSRDSNGALYSCDDETKCALHLHGPKLGYPLHNVQPESSATGLMLAVGNVGKFLAPRSESNMFLTRNAGITWEEVHKGAHIWAFGDSGSILVIANQEQLTDHVQYTTDHGLHWKEYNFGFQVWAHSITSDPGGSSRKFLLVGVKAPWRRGEPPNTILYLNFGELTSRQCVLDESDPARNDFELWKPSEDFGQCLLGSKTAHYRKKRSANCYIGDLDIPPPTVLEHCECTAADFECEYNYVRDSTGECVLVPGAMSLASENTCVGDDEFWYERAAYRKISKSLCINGTRLDQGTAHHCHDHWFKSFASRFWWTFVVLPVGIIALVAVWWYRRRGPKRGDIRLPDVLE